MRPSASVSAAGSPALNSSPTSPSSSRQHVLERQQARRAAELVDDERLVRAPLAQLAQDAIGGDALVHAGIGRIRLGERGAGPPFDEPAHEVLRVQDADDVVDRVAIDRQPRVGALRDDADDLVQRRVDVERRDLASRHHQLLGLAQVQPQRALQSAVLVGLEQAAVAALRDEQLDLVRRVNVAVSLMRRAQQAEEEQPGAVQPRDERAVDPQRRHHRDERVERRLASGTGARATSGRARAKTTCATVSASRTATVDVDCAATSCSPPSAAKNGVSQTAIVACAYAPRTRLESVMPIWHAAM